MVQGLPFQGSFVRLTKQRILGAGDVWGKSYDYHNFRYVSFHVEKMKHHRLRRSFPPESPGFSLPFLRGGSRHRCNHGTHLLLFLPLLFGARQAGATFSSAPDSQISPSYRAKYIHLLWLQSFWVSDLHRLPDTFSPCCVLLFACVFGGFLFAGNRGLALPGQTANQIVRHHAF